MASPTSDDFHDQPPAMDYREHERTYQGFLRMTKWTVIVLAVSMVVLFFLINP